MKRTPIRKIRRNASPIASTPETRIEAKCKCGRTVVKILNSAMPTVWKNGDRYIYPERDDGWCVFRCDRCLTVVDELFPRTIQAPDYSGAAYLETVTEEGCL